jgi:LPS-assembly protein
MLECHVFHLEYQIKRVVTLPVVMFVLAAVMISFVTTSSAQDDGAEDKKHPGVKTSPGKNVKNKKPIPTRIKADTLEYDKKTRTYYLSGHVVIVKGDAVLKAQYVDYYEENSFAVAKGDVYYDDPDVRMHAVEARMYLDKKTGAASTADVFFKKGKYTVSDTSIEKSGTRPGDANVHWRLTGTTIEKKGEKEYYVENARFTTCDAPAAWCFEADKATAVAGDSITAKDVTFKVNDVPVAYSPYFFSPLERKTGFLLPTFGFTGNKGAYFNQPFFWAVSDNRDLTFNVDTYSSRGVGEGVQYRYVERGNIEGKWDLYHIHDKVAGEDFFKLNGEHTQFLDNGFSTVVGANYLNDKKYNDIYSTKMETRVGRFMESSADVSYSTDASRVFLQSQYWVDLRDKTSGLSQKLPEVGFVLHPRDAAGLFDYSASATAANFYSKSGVEGQRLDIFPRLYKSVGDAVRLSQTAGVRASLYSLDNYAGDKNPHNESVNYTASLDTKFIGRYDSLTHIVEPSVSYQYISRDNRAPVFDSVEYFDKRSVVEPALMNYFRDDDGAFLMVRLSSPYDINADTDSNSGSGAAANFASDANAGALSNGKPWQPFKLQARLMRPLNFKAEASYDYYKEDVASANSEVGFDILGMGISLGERYNRENDIFYLTGGIGYNITKDLRINTSAWYDTKDNEDQKLRNVEVAAVYMKQCWGTKILYNKTPTDYTVFFIIELRGVGEYRISGI